MAPMSSAIITTASASGMRILQGTFRMQIFSRTTIVTGAKDLTAAAQFPSLFDCERWNPTWLDHATPTRLDHAAVEEVSNCILATRVTSQLFDAYSGRLPIKPALPYRLQWSYENTAAKVHEPSIPWEAGQQQMPEHHPSTILQKRNARAVRSHLIVTSKGRRSSQCHRKCNC